MKPERLSAAPQERYIDCLCHPFGIVFLVADVSIIMTSLRDFFGYGCGFVEREYGVVIETYMVFETL